MLIEFADQVEMVKQTALAHGVPLIRYVDAPRSGTGPERVDVFLDNMLQALTRPLSETEKQSGRYIPPEQPRVFFEGTLDAAQDFYQRAKPILLTGRAPIAMYTDGLPIIIPTEERVAEMLKGTSHRPDEVVSLQSDRKTQRGATIEKGTGVEFPR